MAAGDHELPIEDESLPQEQQRGLLFTGERVNGLLPQQLAAIGDFASRVYGVEMRVVADIRALGQTALTEVETDRPEPVLATRDDFYTFAHPRGFTNQVAGQAWAWVERMATDRATRKDRSSKLDGLPPIRMHGWSVDLRSVYDHASQAMRQIDVFSGGDHRDYFLVTMVNEVLQPEEPLRDRYRERYGP
jgi:hypothetical protein